jgi:hypothetical protein
VAQDPNGQGGTGVGSESETCEDAAVRELVDLILKDRENVLSRMYQITSMRLAARIQSQAPGARTLEELVKQTLPSMEASLQSIKTSAEVQKKLQDIYGRYGKLADLERANRDLEGLIGRVEKLYYYKKGSRLMNPDVSSYILATAISDPEAGLSDTDAATVWAMEKIRVAAERRDRDFAIGKADGNLMNASSLAAIPLGSIKGIERYSSEKIAKKIESNEAAISKVVASAYVTVKESLKRCLVEDAKKKNCASCADERLNTFEKNQLALEEIKRAILKRVGEKDEAAIQTELVGKFRKLKPGSSRRNTRPRSTPTPSASPTPSAYRFVPPAIQPMVRDNTYVKPPVIIPIDRKPR